MALPQYFPGARAIAVASAALILGGCATFSADGGMDAVSTMTKERTGQAVQISKAGENEAMSATVKQLLAKPLTADAAVQIALLNNRGLQSSLAQLGIAESDLVQAGRLPNPGFSFGRMRGGDDVEIERGVMFDLLGILTMPIRSKIEGRRFEQAKLQAAADAVELAADTRQAYFNAVAAQQTVQYMQQVQEAADASAELSRRLAQVGNVSKLDQAREQVFYADATAQVARARHNATAAREQLVRLLGLWGADTSFKLPDRLPDLPKALRDVANIEQLAMEQRLDVQMAKRSAHATASALGLTKATRFVNVLEAGYVNTSETGAPRANGYEVELELPIFDWSGARTARAEAMYMQSVHQTADLAVRARSQVREAYSAYRTTYDIARHYQTEIVPLRKQISDEVVLRYNGMLASVFELLSDARDQISSVNAAIESQRDFWIAETDLQAAINGTGGETQPMASAATAEAGAPAH